MSIATTSEPEAAPAQILTRPLILAAGCVALADWLFYGWWDLGISLPLFLGVLGTAGVASNGAHTAGRRTGIIMIAVFAAGLLALVEQVNWLSAIWAGVATAMFVVVMTAPDRAPWEQRLYEVLILPVLGPFQFATDVIWQAWQWLRRDHGWLRLDYLIGWVVPLGIFAVFLSLFVSANPLIERGVLQIDWQAALNLLNPLRLAFWILLAGAIWPFVFRRNRRHWNPESKRGDNISAVNSGLDYLVGTAATLRSLVLFNALFALQTAMDLTYLWGGAALPDGLTYATYAHRGAYPLIATALLAAAFVLVAMRRGGPAEQSRLIRPLVLIFTAQNVLLVISSIFRLDLYVAIYSLTYLRLAAFIWMGLVAAGLLLILAKIMLLKSTYWLITANAITLAIVLYGCCFLNAPWLIAHYNVEHSKEVSGTGQNLDLRYVESLGPQAYAALERHAAKLPTFSVSFARSENWRGWSFRTWRLDRYFAKPLTERLTSPVGGQG